MVTACAYGVNTVFLIYHVPTTAVVELILLMVNVVLLIYPPLK